MCPHPSKQNPRPDLKAGAQIADENPGGMAELDLSIVERYADHLERKASGRITLFTIFFALVGSMLGSVPLFPLKYGLIPHHLGYATLLVGAAAGGYLGYTMGARRAEGLRLQAQLMLHQLKLGQSLVQVATPVASVPLSYVPPAPLSVPPPAPVAPAPLVGAPAPAAPAPAPPLLSPPPPVLPATERALVAPEPAVSAAPPLSTPVQQLPPSQPAPPAAVVAPPAAQLPGPRLVDPAPAPTPGVTPAAPPAMPPLSS